MARLAATTMDRRNGRYTPAPDDKAAPAAGWPRGSPCAPAASRADRRPRARLCAGQSRHSAEGARRRFPALLPAQSEAMPADRHLRAGRSGACRTLGEDLDIRTDLPRYRVWKNGELVAEPDDVREFWRDDLVSFVIGCSFSFEEALMAEGIELRHIARGCNVPMYRTSIATHGGRPVPRADGGVDAADDAGGRDPRRADHHALSGGARRAGAYRQAGADRHQGHR